MRVLFRSMGLSLLLPVAGFGCERDPPAPAQATPAPPVAEGTSPAEPDSSPFGESGGEPPGVRDDGSIVSAVQWFAGSVAQAQAQAAVEGKLVFVDVGAYWCPPCQELEETVFVLPRVGEALAARYVPVRVDAEKEAGPELVEQHRIAAFPTLLVLESSGVERGRIVEGFDADALLASLERIERGQSVLGDLVAEVEANPDDFELRQRLGHLHALEGDRPRAEAQFAAVLEADPRNRLGLTSRVLYDRALFITHKLDGQHEAAIAQLRALQVAFPDSREAVRAYRHIGRMLHARGRADEAAAALEAMLGLDASDASLASSYGWFSFRQKFRPARGLEVVTAAAARHPDNAELHYLQAELAQLTGDPAGALAAIRRALALEPQSAFFRRQVRRFEAGA